MTAKDQSKPELQKVPEVPEVQEVQKVQRGTESTKPQEVSVAELRPTEARLLAEEGSADPGALGKTELGEVKPLVLVVIDGWGVAPPSKGNAVFRARTPHWDRLVKEYPYGELIASGESVGLTANENGSSNVGHLTIGAGRVVQLSVTKINQDIDDESFFDNPALHLIRNTLNQKRSKLHLIGLIGVGTVHASMKHFWAILDYCEKNEIRNVFLHLFTDGRDSPPDGAKKIVEEIETRLKKTNVGQIASICGRYYSMDRDRRWERTQKAYDAIVAGKGQMEKSALEAMNYWYSKKVTDEFIEPTVIVQSTRSTTGTKGTEGTEGDPSTAPPQPAGRAQAFVSEAAQARRDDKTDLKSLSVLSSTESREGDTKLAQVKEQLSTIKDKISDIAATQDGEPASALRQALGFGEARPVATVQPGDVVFFFNFRADRARQLTQLFCEKKPYRGTKGTTSTRSTTGIATLLPPMAGSAAVSRKLEMEGTESTESSESTEGTEPATAGPASAQGSGEAKQGLFASMTNYHKDLAVDLALYDTAPVETPVAEVMAKAGLKQLHLAESEKERFVTYYFDGLRQEPFNGEDIVIVPSPNVPTYDKKPEMSLPELTVEFLKGFHSRKYQFFLVNLANPDMVAHSGNLRATIKACESVDKALGVIASEVLKAKGALIITADHGNAEELVTLPIFAYFFTTARGSVNTDHSNNPVPIVFVSDELRGKGPVPKGTLADVGPTILKLFGLEVPQVMAGKNLLEPLATSH